MAAQKEAGEEIAAERFILRSQRCFVGSGAEGDFILRRKGVGGKAVANARKLQSMQQEPDFSGRLRTDLDAIFGGCGNQREQAVDSRLSALDGRRSREGVNQPRLKIADVSEVHRRQLLAAFVEREELKAGSGVVQPSHAFSRCPPRSNRHNNLESAKVTASVAIRAAMIQPKDSECQNAVHHRRRLCLADANHSLCRRAAQQASAHIGGPEAVFQIHRRTHPIDLCSDKVTGENALQQPLIIAPRGFTGGGGGSIARGNQFEGLRFGRAHAAR